MADIMKALNETNAGQGQELIQEQVSTKVIEYLTEQQVVRKILPSIKINSKSVRFPKFTGSGLSTAWFSDDVTGYPVSDSTPATGDTTVNAYRLMAKVYVTDDLRDDAVVDVFDYVARMTAQEIANSEESAFLEGDGSTVPITGFAHWSGVNTIAPSDATNGDLISLDKFTKAWELIRKGYGSADSIIMRPEHYRQLLDLKDSNNRPIFTPASYGDAVMQSGAVGLLYGMKVYVTTNISIDNATYANPVANIFVLDSKRSGLIIDRKAVDLETKREPDYARTMLVVSKRTGFFVQYPKTVCVVQGVRTA